MSSLFAYVLAAASAPPPGGTAYHQEVAQAVAAAAGLVAMLVVIFLVFKAMYLILTFFTRAAFLFTFGIFVSVVVIGALNR